MPELHGVAHAARAAARSAIICLQKTLDYRSTESFDLTHAATRAHGAVSLSAIFSSFVARQLLPSSKCRVRVWAHLPLYYDQPTRACRASRGVSRAHVSSCTTTGALAARALRTFQVRSPHVKGASPPFAALVRCVKARPGGCLNPLCLAGLMCELGAWQEDPASWTPSPNSVLPRPPLSPALCPLVCGNCRVGAAHAL
jgi:hypothetical protein